MTSITASNRVWVLLASEMKSGLILAVKLTETVDPLELNIHGKSVI